MNGLLLPVKGLTCTSTSPQGDRQTRAHMRKPTRRSPAPRTHPRTHVHIREPRAYPRPSTQDCRARSALTHIDNHSPAHRHPGTRPQPRIRGTQPRPRQLERGKREHATEQRQDTARRIQKSRIRRSGLMVGDTGIEPVTSSVSGKRAPAAPIARAEDGTRTRDPHLGKVMLYQLSHIRVNRLCGWA